MKREERYYILKLSDIDNYLDAEQKADLEKLSCIIRKKRRLLGNSDLSAVVIESGWPEFEPTCAALAKRVDEEKLAEITVKYQYQEKEEDQILKSFFHLS